MTNKKIIISRREFCRTCFVGSAGIACPSMLLADVRRNKQKVESKIKTPPPLEARPARWYKQLPELKVKCTLCPQMCVVADRERGFCGVRENWHGNYYTLVHSRPCALHSDPVEKKPLFHYLPGTDSFSLATAGCNMECRFCQNWRISQFRPEQVESQYVPPEMVVKMALHHRASSIACTYTEPVIFAEYMYDIAAISKKRGIGTIMISNGYISKTPMKQLCKVLSAVKIDLKAFSDSFYVKYCSGKLKPVLERLQDIVAAKKWLELVVLIIPTLNDSLEENRRMCKFIKKELGDQVPIHFTRFHPTYKLNNLPPTPVNTLERIWTVAREEGLKYVYLGNVTGHKYESTFCPSCSKILIGRVGFRILKNTIKQGKCSKCGTVIPGVWSKNDI